MRSIRAGARNSSCSSPCCRQLVRRSPDRRRRRRRARCHRLVAPPEARWSDHNRGNRPRPGRGQHRQHARRHRRACQRTNPPARSWRAASRVLSVQGRRPRQEGRSVDEAVERATSRRRARSRSPRWRPPQASVNGAAAPKRPTPSAKRHGELRCARRVSFGGHARNRRRHQGTGRETRRLPTPPAPMSCSSRPRSPPPASTSTVLYAPFDGIVAKSSRRNRRVLRLRRPVCNAAGDQPDRRFLSLRRAPMDE